MVKVDDSYSATFANFTSARQCVDNVSIIALLPVQDLHHHQFFLSSSLPFQAHLNKVHEADSRAAR